MQQKTMMALFISLIILCYWIVFPINLLFQLISISLFLITFYIKKIKLFSFIITIILSFFYNDIGIILSFYFVHYSLYPFLGLIFIIKSTQPFSYILIYCSMFIIFYYEKITNNAYVSLLKSRDLLKNENLILIEMHKNLLTQQQAFIDTSLLNERNRISCEIHDQSGHIIASTIMQIAALKAYELDTDKKTLLNDIQKNLQNAMTHIRSILHNEVILDELKLEIQKIANLYPQLKTTIHCDYISKLHLNTIVHLSAITKEAFTNVVKHANATSVSIDIYETSQFLIYHFKDNGSNKKTKENGIGLYSMKLRAQSLDALLAISKNYEIHLRIKKEKL